MKSGFCPKCGSNEVDIYNCERQDLLGYRGYVDEYICFNCGYSEQYFLEAGLRLMRNRKAQKERDKKKKNDK